VGTAGAGTVQEVSPVRPTSLFHPPWSVHVPKSKLRVHQQFYTCSAPRLFNMIAFRLTKKENLKSFTYHLKNYLLSYECVEDFFAIVV
jgi:hypothetical protein